MNSLIDTLPIAAIALTLLIALCAVAEFAGRWRRRGGEGGETNYAASAAVSLLALMISFTFSVSLNRYDARRDLVVEEAAAIGMVWQRASCCANRRAARWKPRCAPISIAGSIISSRIG